jgi:transcriptional regulator
VAALGPSATKVFAPKVLREVHYRVLTLAALGYTNVEIAARLGYTRERVGIIISAPAAQSEIQRLREKLEDRIIDQELEEEEIYLDRKARIQAKRQRAEVLDLVDAEARDHLAMRDYNAIIADLEDRYGTPRKSTNVNLSANFATELEKSIARSEAVEASRGATIPETLP